MALDVIVRLINLAREAGKAEPGTDRPDVGDVILLVDANGVYLRTADGTYLAVKM